MTHGIMSKSKSVAAWVHVATAEIGVREIKGHAHAPHILEYHQATSLRASDDETPWCSAFVNWVMGRVGIKGTGRANARSWLDWGHELAEPRQGCVVVLWRGMPDGWQGHVGFYMGRDSQGRVLVLGGNQADEVNISPYPVHRLLGYRWPEGVDMDAEVAPEPKPLAESRTVQGGAVATLATTGAATAGAMAEQADAIKGALLPLLPYLPWLKYGLIAVTLAAVAAMVWARIDDRRRMAR